MPKKTITTGNERECSNCGKSARLDRSLTVQEGGRVVAVICEACQQARKIQITLNKDKQQHWEFSQYFPVEG